MNVNAETLTVTVCFPNPRAAAEFFLRPLCARGSFAAQAAMEQLRTSGRVDWEAANDAAFARQTATSACDEDLRPEPETFCSRGGLVLAQDLGVCFGRGRSEMILRGCEVTVAARGRSEMILRGCEVTVAARGLWGDSDPADVADAIAGRLLGGLSPWQQTDERKALARKILALWAKDRKNRDAAQARAAEEERLARRSGVTVAEYRARLAKAARRSGRAGSGGKRNWTARRAVAA